MSNDTVLNTPVLWINKYLQNKISLLSNLEDVPFFPTVPSTIDSLTQSFATSNGVMATYDRMFKMNRQSFPHIKCEQVLYYFYATAETSVEKMIQITESVYRLLDRGDESAEEINNWCSNRRVNIGTGQLPNYIDNMFYFHDFKVYQLEEVRDIIDFGTARTYAGNKIIIDFDYHQMPDLTSNSWAPEAKLSGNNKITI
jgi:hypothetical protein